jgi:hypothetical protein
MKILIRIWLFAINLIYRFFPASSSEIFGSWWTLNSKYRHLIDPPNPEYLDFMNFIMDGHVFVTTDKFLASLRDSLTCEITNDQKVMFVDAVRISDVEFESVSNHLEYDGEGLWNLWNELFPETAQFRKPIHAGKMWYDQYRKSN